MNRFLDIALRNAARGFRVMPIKGKNAFLPNWPTLATTDEKQIKEWAKQFPDCNCGVAGGSDVIIMDSDRVSRLKELCSKHAEWLNTYSVTSGRPDRAHFYFLATPEVLEFGNRKHEDHGIRGNIFEIKGRGAQATAEGSIHPDTGQVYRITQDLPLIPFPAGLMALIRECYGRDNGPRERVPREKIGEGGRHDALVREAGRVLRVTEMSKPVLTAHLQDFNEQWLEPPIDSEEVERVAISCNWKPEPEVGVITIGSSQPKAPEAAPIRERVKPTYAIEVWDGTVVGEFAKLCAQDNNVPRKMYAEAFRCALGAVMGDRLSCSTVDNLVPRSFTVIVAPKGKGKGTAIRRAVWFFSQSWYGGSRHTGGLTVQGDTASLLSGVRDFDWKPKGIGAWMAAASSVPGMARLTKDLESTIKNKPHMTWGNTLPRILSVHEEMKTFLSTLFIEGGVGSGMEGVVCQLWDDVSFHGTATGTRDAVYGEMMFSMLCGVTEQDWFDLLSRGNAVGGGLMSRFNIIGTEGQYDNVSKLKPIDFTPLQETFLPRVMQLEDAHVKIASTEAADRVISEWADNLPEGSERMNIHAWRSALLLAWLKHEDAISPKTAEDAVRLGQYQVDSHDYYRTTSADNAVAKVQAKILRALELRGPMTKRDLQQRTNAHRDGTELWNRALAGLVQDGRIGKGQDSKYYLAAE